MDDERKPLTLREIWQQLADELFSLERGFPYTLVQLFRAPGATVRRYVLHRDPRITKPIRYFLIPGTLFTALMLALRPRFEALTPAAPSSRQAVMTDFAYEHMLLLAVAGIVAGAIAIWLVFRARRPTLVETVVLSTYANAQGLWLNGPLLVAIAYGAPKAVAIAGTIASVAYNLWVTVDYFGGGWRNWLLALLSAVVAQVIAGVPIMIGAALID